MNGVGVTPIPALGIRPSLFDLNPGEVLPRDVPRGITRLFLPTWTFGQLFVDSIGLLLLGSFRSRDAIPESGWANTVGRCFADSGPAGRWGFAV